MDKPNIQLHLISKDVQERQTLDPNLHLVGWLGDNCNVCGRVPSCARLLKLLMKGKHLKPSCIEVEVGDNCVQFLKMFMKGKLLKPSCIVVEVEIKNR